MKTGVTLSFELNHLVMNSKGIINYQIRIGCPNCHVRIISLCGKLWTNDRSGFLAESIHYDILACYMLLNSKRRTVPLQSQIHECIKLIECVKICCKISNYNQNRDENNTKNEISSSNTYSQISWLP